MKLAYNPLPWAMSNGSFDHELIPPLDRLAGILLPAGFAAIQSDIPPGTTAATFRDALLAAGLAPGPGYFSAPFDDTDQLPAIIERAARAAADQATLGLTEIFLACALNSVRAERPGVGIEADGDRVQRIAAAIGRASERMLAEGITPCLHPHVGTWIETEDEADAVLAAVDRRALLVGPDNGHLIWAGADPAAFTARHADRVGAVHVKDIRLGVLAQCRERGAGFHASVEAHVCTEPGRGDADLAGFLGALPAGFAGWMVVEVDCFDLPARESVAAAGDWARSVLA